MSRADELLGMLKLPVPAEHEPKVWMGSHPWYRRQVYVGAGSRPAAWFVTHSPSLPNPDYEAFRDDDIKELLARGEIVSAWPGTHASPLGYVWRGETK